MAQQPIALIVMSLFSSAEIHMLNKYAPTSGMAQPKNN